MLLSSRHEPSRVAAAKKLSELLPHDKQLVVPALVQATQESSAEVRRAARELLNAGRIGAAMPGVVETLREALAEPEAQDRRTAIANLASFAGGTPQFLADLLRGLQDPDTGVRDTAAYYVADTLRSDVRCSAEQLEVLWRSLSDASPNVRRYLARGLGGVNPGDARLKPVIREVLSDAKALEYQLVDAVELVARLVEADAAQLLGEPGHAWPARVALARTRFANLAERGVAELAALIDGDDEAQRIDALRASAKIPDALGAALDPHVVRCSGAGMTPKVREAALRALRPRVAPDTRVELARAALAAPERDVQWGAQEVLGGLTTARPAEVVDTILPLLGGANSDDLARVLGWVGPPAARAVPRLVELLQQRPSQTLVYTLGAIGAPACAAVPPLVELAASTSDSYLRFTVLGALRSIGLAGCEAAVVEKLCALLAQPDPRVRDAVLTALETTGDPAPDVVRDALEQSVVKEEGLPEARRRRVLRLARCGGEVTPTLVRALEDRDEQVAADALRALQQLGAAAVPFLERMRGDPGCADRARAAFALEQLGQR